LKGAKCACVERRSTTAGRLPLTVKKMVHENRVAKTGMPSSGNVVSTQEKIKRAVREDVTGSN